MSGGSSNRGAKGVYTDFESSDDDVDWEEEFTDDLHLELRQVCRLGDKAMLKTFLVIYQEDWQLNISSCVDVKEILFIKTRLSHGVNIRSGRHVPRSGDYDFKTLINTLIETKAHLKIEGRKFGDFEIPENLMDDKRFDEAKFYRWITMKNKEANEIIEAKRLL